MKIFVPIRLRICTRCGHEECPCCRDWCDRCIFDEGNTVCEESGECVYTEPRDDEGYARLDAAMAQFPNGANMWDTPGGINVQDDDEPVPS